MNPNNTSILARSLLSLLLCLCAGVSFAQDIPWAGSAEEVGMSAERLKRINAALSGSYAKP
jgi:hypothetical protein